VLQRVMKQHLVSYAYSFWSSARTFAWSEPGRTVPIRAEPIRSDPVRAQLYSASQGNSRKKGSLVLALTTDI
jgi:hypothetical protein